MSYAPPRRVLLQRSWLALAVGALTLAGCAPAELPQVKDSQVSTTDAVLAIRLSNSPGSGSQSLAVPDGYLLLVKEDGTGTALDVGAMVGGKLLWNEAGPYLGTTHDEILVNDAGLRRFPRGLKVLDEVLRRPTSDGRGFITFYSWDRVQSAFRGDEHGNLERTDNPGMYQVNGVYQDRLLSIVTTRYTPDLEADARRVAQQAHEAGVLAEPVPASSSLDVLVQVYPHQDGQPVVLAAAPEDESLQPGPWYTTCYQGKVYLPTFRRAHPDAAPDNNLDPWAGHLVIQSWDLGTGARNTVPVTSPDGAPAQITAEEAFSDTGHLKGPLYTCVTRNGDVLSVDVTTGLLQNRFQIPLSDKDWQSRYQVTDTDVYALDVPHDTTKPLTLTRYDLTTGTPHHLMTINDTSHYQDGNLLTDQVFVKSIALRPSYLQQLAARS
ncbi:hypothetical protein [Actinomyces trachealis]|uniref:hypothetical protein n=1 Tax=Actinomyces trachealis TaxID=2763540 RepID=UPI001892C3B6|nr:hypothetical protein [Actinomyces trachealis]